MPQLFSVLAIIAPVGKNAAAIQLCDVIMASITFDTLRYANRLKAAGVSQQQAEAEAEALSEVLETNVRDMASKLDIELLRAEMRTQLAETKVDLIR